jgi:hypothetical protein
MFLVAPALASGTEVIFTDDATPNILTDWIQVNRNALFSPYDYCSGRLSAPSVAAIALFSTHSAYYGNAGTKSQQNLPHHHNLTRSHCSILESYEPCPISGETCIPQAEIRTTYSIHSVFVFVPLCWQLRIRSWNESVFEYIWSNRQEERDTTQRESHHFSLIKLSSDHGQLHHSQTDKSTGPLSSTWRAKFVQDQICSALHVGSKDAVQYSTVQPTTHIGFQYPCPIRASHAVRRSITHYWFPWFAEGRVVLV